MLNGVNEHAGLLCNMLGLKVSECMEGMPVGRFRDIYLNANGTEIHLLTRNGGRNRDCWNNDDQSIMGECMCPGCIQTQLLPQHKNYITDDDDSFDCTFAITRFRVPEEYSELAKSLAAEAKANGNQPQTLEEKTMAAIERIKNMSPEELRADAAFGGLIEQLENAIDQSEPITMLDSDAKPIA